MVNRQVREKKTYRVEEAGTVGTKRHEEENNRGQAKSESNTAKERQRDT